MTKIEQMLYTGKTHTSGGRDGKSRSADRRLDITLSPPGASGSGTNPEQLFAAGWSACSIGAMRLAAGKMQIVLPADQAVDAEVDLGMTGDSYFLRVRLNVSPARRRPRNLAGSGGRRASDMSVLQGHTRQHLRRDQPSIARSFLEQVCRSSAG
jgi:lipoyl-dependent peroxiredoxin